MIVSEETSADCTYIRTPPPSLITMAAALISAALLLLPAAHSFAPPTTSLCYGSKISQHHHLHQIKRKESSYTTLHLYNKFHEYAWEKMHYNDESSDVSTVPDNLKSNKSPVKGSDNNVVACIRSMSEFRNPDATSNANVEALRLARSAFLETQTDSSEALESPMAIHVLNFVLFPQTELRDASSGAHVGLPIFGADIVSLPGNKHLVALDFQPVLPLNNEVESSAKLFPEQYSHLETKLLAIHAKYQKGSDDATDPLLAWGGDIPPQALRWFSPYALWTRLSDENAIQTVSTTVWDAYKEYVDLYFELMNAVQTDLDDGKLEIKLSGEENNSVLSGQREYLEYRRINDPARPMLQRLYGKDWAEELIDGVLFPTI
mmetsp:Transcript_12303/g.18869  ORF Transcript_12303/g.18869 Transcript_12303/m.18869 type:complete len:376 (-) Transcript_12303:60-1187(-)